METDNRPTRRKRLLTRACDVQPAKRHKANIPATEEHRRAIAALTDMFENMMVSPTLNILSNDVLLIVFEHLVPEPVTVGIRHSPGKARTSLWDLTATEWRTYMARRSDLLSLRRVSQRLNSLVNPLLFRHMVLGSPKSMVLVLSQLVQNPSLGPKIRHISSAVDLDEPGMAMCFWMTWQLQGHRSLFGHLNPSLAHDDPFWKLSNWFNESTNGSHDPQFPSIVLCTILCFANKLEGLNLRLHEPCPQRPRTTLWSWFLNDDKPWPTTSYSIPQKITTSYPSWEELNNNPCWPPPFLSTVVIECGKDFGGSFITCHIFQHADSVRCSRIAQRFSKTRKQLLTKDLAHYIAQASPTLHTLSLIHI